MSRSSKHWSGQLVAETHALRTASPCHRLQRIEEALGTVIGEASLRDQWAQAVVCSVAAAKLTSATCDRSLHGEVRESAGPFVAAVLDAAAVFPAAGISASASDLAYFYERFLKTYSASTKTRRGVFYTPRPLVRYVVRELDQALRRDFGLADGLADTATWGEVSERTGVAVPDNADPQRPFVRILDPAVGTGVFLAAVIEQVHESLEQRWRSEGRTRRDRSEAWCAYVPRHLLPRLWGIELLLPALTVAHWNLVATLDSTGYRLAAGQRLSLVLSDTLAGERKEPTAGPMPSDLADELRRAAKVGFHWPVTVLLGNPPFSGISTNHSLWIRQLLRGRDGTGRRAANYYEVDGRQLGERKLWLQDDYVKFIRYAQWRVESVGTGIVGLVTNHGYLDNTTFRGMRAALLKTFPRVTVLDLHGNRKKHEVTPHGGRDENVFEIEQGVAVGMFSRPPNATPESVRHGELWGTRRQKLAALEHSPNAWARLSPASPHYFFTSLPPSDQGEYDAAFPLNEIMPVHSTAAVTARDRFVIGWNRRELLDRLQQFGDLSIGDEEIRAKYFTNSRSRRYLAGDTRGWKLAAARKRLAAAERWRQCITTCLYRPFDRRPIFWTDWMIDWPRPEIMRHLASGNNLALVARRQMLPTQPCSFFWISDRITIDGVIRSDNRGSESVFPLYLIPPPGVVAGGPAARGAANFNPSFVAAVAKTLGWKWRRRGGGDLIHSFGPRDLLHYIYGLFHSSQYRIRYAAQLRIDFPRVLLPNGGLLFRQLAEAGRRLAEIHLERPQALAGDVDLRLTAAPPRHLKRGFPCHRSGRIWLDRTCHLRSIPESVWEYRVGGHQVCRKWLRDRRHRTLTVADYGRYGRIVGAIHATLRWMGEIDRRVNAAGGWESAFFRARTDDS